MVENIPIRLRFKVLICGVSILLLACNSKKNSENNVPELKLSTLQQVQLGYLVIKDFIPLETNSQNLMGIDLRIRFDDTNFYVYDESVRDGIHKFGRDGSFGGSVATVGEGPNQILDLNDFYITPDGHLEVLSTVGDQSTLIKITENEPEVLFKIDYIASSFSKLPNGNFLLYGSYNLPLTKHRLVLVDKKGNIVDRYLENNYENHMLPMTERNFFETDDELFITEIFNNRIYRFKEKLNGYLEIDMGELRLPSNFWERDIMESFPDLVENKFGSLMGVFSDKDLMIINIHVQGESGNSKKLVFIDFRKRIKSVFTSDSSNNNLFHNPIGVEDGKAFFYTYQSTLKSMPSDYLSKDLLDKIPDLEFDYPVIIAVEVL